MEEWLALPSACLPPTALSAWTEKLTELGFEPTIDRDDASGSWVEIGSLRVRGYAMLEGVSVDAINFELHGDDPSIALDVLRRAAESLGWELHIEDEQEDSDF